MFGSRCPGASGGTLQCILGTNLYFFPTQSWRKTTYADVNINHFRFNSFVHWGARDDLHVDGKNFQPSQRGAGLHFQAPRWS